MGTLAGTRAGNEVVAVTNVAITTIRQGLGSSNLAFKCPPRYSLVTKTTSPRCLQRNTSDSCRGEKMASYEEPLKESANRIQMSLVTRKTSPPCLWRNTSDTCRVAREERLKGWGSFKHSTNRIQMSLINRMTSRPCVLKKQKSPKKKKKKKKKKS